MNNHCAPEFGLTLTRLVIYQHQCSCGEDVEDWTVFDEPTVRNESVCIVRGDSSAGADK